MDNKNPLEKLTALCQEYLVTKAPYTLPPKAKEVLVQFAPWGTIVVFVLTLPLVLGVLGISLFFMPFLFLGAHGYGIISLLLLAVTVVLELMAIPGLFKRQLSAWNLSLYVLFQVKSMYK